MSMTIDKPKKARRAVKIFLTLASGILVLGASGVYVAKGHFIKESPCESSGMDLWNKDHCDCLGHKVHVPRTGIGTDEPDVEHCIGYVLKSWKNRSRSSLRLEVEPLSSSVLILGASEYRISPSPRPNKIVIDRLDKVYDLQPGQPSPSTVNINIDRGYVETDGKIKFGDTSPLHIEITHPGYRPWSADIVPETNPIEIHAKLERLDTK